MRTAARHVGVAAIWLSGTAPLVAEGRATSCARPFRAAVIAAFATKYSWDITVDVEDELGEVTLVRVDVTRRVMGRP